MIRVEFSQDRRQCFAQVFRDQARTERVGARPVEKNGGTGRLKAMYTLRKVPRDKSGQDIT